MRVVVTGGTGFLGQKLGAALAERGRLSDAAGTQQQISEIVLFDRAGPQAPLSDRRIKVVTGDINSSEDIARVIAPGTGSIFHLAAVVSGEAEQNFDLGLRVNLDGTRAILDQCRRLPAPPRLIFTSSMAAFGGELPPVLHDTTPLNPQTSYGNQKAACEFMVNDWSRKGFIDGRSLRLPTIVVRPGKPNKAASGFASSIIREPLMGRDYVCPVPPETTMWMLSPRRIVEAMIHAHELPAERWGVNRVLNPPGIRVSMTEAVDAVRRLGGDAAAGRVRFEPDPFIVRIVSGWPKAFATPRALALGFKADADIDAIVQAFIEDERPG
ncbi:MAG: D-erythronate dehydrogenase [Pseudomonadota bacterium]|nr:D-erythronate dehydrogenase [Pseudomonadota bacterium]